MLIFLGSSLACDQSTLSGSGGGPTGRETKGRPSRGPNAARSSGLCRCCREMVTGGGRAGLVGRAAISSSLGVAVSPAAPGFDAISHGWRAGRCDAGSSFAWVLSPMVLVVRCVDRKGAPVPPIDKLRFRRESGHWGHDVVGIYFHDPLFPWPPREDMGLVRRLLRAEASNASRWCLAI